MEFTVIEKIVALQGRETTLERIEVFEITTKTEVCADDILNSEEFDKHDPILQRSLTKESKFKWILEILHSKDGGFVGKRSI
jgi:hypothetical protein